MMRNGKAALLGVARAAIVLVIVTCGPVGVSIGVAAAQDIPTVQGLQCPDARILGAGMFANVCWSALFPMRIAGFTAFPGRDSNPPTDANRQPICACGGDLKKGELPTVGITLGLWQPLRLVEAVRYPYCLPSLGGIRLSTSQATAGGERTVGTIAGDDTPTDDEMGFYNFNVYVFPIMAMLQLMDIPGCNPGQHKDLDLAYTSAFFPNWYDPDLAYFVDPEVLLFANPAAIAALPVDCAAVSTEGAPRDDLFWAAGCWGSNLPAYGYLNPTSSPVRGSSLVATRALGMLSRLGLLERTTGSDALCDPQPMPVLKKSQFRMSMLFPVPEAQSLGSPPAAGAPGSGLQVPEIDPTAFMSGCSHPIGKSTIRWGEWRQRPATGEDFVYLLWQWTDCCVGPALAAP